MLWLTATNQDDFNFHWTLYAPSNGHIVVWNWLENWSERSNFFHLEYYIVYFCKCTPLGLNKLVRPLLDDLKTKFRCGPIPSLTVSVIVKLQFANFRLPLGFGDMPSCLVNRKNTHWITWIPPESECPPFALSFSVPISRI